MPSIRLSIEHVHKGHTGLVLLAEFWGFANQSRVNSIELSIEHVHKGHTELVLLAEFGDLRFLQM